LALISGGLDSMLAAKLIHDQGVEVIGLHFNLPFCKLKIKESFPDIGIKISEIDLGAELLKLLRQPRYGFGSNMNPCIDCKILMLSRAKTMLLEYGASFIITGEVLGQRPMSQNKQALKLIRQVSGLEDLLLRPLSAKLFTPSLPEREGWVNREELFGFNGRRRIGQMQLAKKLGIVKFAYPAGGCLLTDPCFSRRLKELLAHQELNLDNLELLKIGRHFRITEKFRLAVGRDEQENSLLLKLAGSGDYLFHPQNDLAGPTSLARGLNCSSDILTLCAEITAAYSDTGQARQIDVYYKQLPEEEESKHKTTYLPKSGFKHFLI